MAANIPQPSGAAGAPAEGDARTARGLRAQRPVRAKPVEREPRGASLGARAAEEDDPGPIQPLVPAGCTWPVVLGIDPGTIIMGYGAIVVAPDGPRLLVAGTVRPKPRDPVPQRLAHIRRELDELMALCRPTHVAVERVFAARNVQSALRIGEGRGIALAAAAACGAAVEEFAPAEAKKAVLGNGNASKEQVASMVGRQLGIEDFDGPLDVTDALSLALALVRQLEWARKSGRRGTPFP